MTTAPPVYAFTQPLRPWMAQCEELLGLYAGGHAREVSAPATRTLLAG